MFRDLVNEKFIANYPAMAEALLNKGEKPMQNQQKERKYEVKTAFSIVDIYKKLPENCQTARQSFTKLLEDKFSNQKWSSIETVEHNYILSNHQTWLNKVGLISEIKEPIILQEGMILRCLVTMDKVKVIKTNELSQFALLNLSKLELHKVCERICFCSSNQTVEDLATFELIK